MRVIKRVVIAFASFVILPATVFAQASLSGFIIVDLRTFDWRFVVDC